MSRPWKSRPFFGCKKLTTNLLHLNISSFTPRVTPLPLHQIHPTCRPSWTLSNVGNFDSKHSNNTELLAQTMSLQCMPGVLTHQIHIIIVTWRKMKMRNEKCSTIQNPIEFIKWLRDYPAWYHFSVPGKREQSIHLKEFDHEGCHSTSLPGKR